ncbi:MAG: F0F1 ATP synthase subunit alpha [Tepidanaerobacteraceae bacterium]|jgi:F-type H+-transporting ATPase subunit alpha|nr:F0F1 ATP synthase subunit alpha [Tepidanaerobacteraceae bacterium]
MQVAPDEIISVIEDKIKSYEKYLEVDEVGYVMSVGDGIARIYGARKAMAGELLAFKNGICGLALNLEEDFIGCVLLGSDTEIREGDEVHLTGRIVEVPVGEELLGRVVDALGRPIDGMGPIEAQTTRPVEYPAPGIIERRPVNTPLETGIKAIDAMVPIGRGQRELIIGDRQTGKTAIALDAIINQKGKGVYSIYVAIGQKSSSVARLVETLRENGAMDYTIVVAANASDLAPLQYIAPYAGCAMAEEFMYKGKDVLIVYDDLSKHAVAYRAMTLLLRRPPGREAFPGDIFYLHSRLLERAARLSKKFGGGSMTALPIVETLAGDVSAYIPTNVISITDGQIYLESELFNSGVRPAINAGLSVSRVGGAAQHKIMKQVAGRIRLDLAQYRELSAFARFGTELESEARQSLARGERIVEILKQEQLQPMNLAFEILALYAVTHGFLDDVDVAEVKRFEKEMLEYIKSAHKKLLEEMEQKKAMDDELEEKMKKAIAQFKDRFKAGEKQTF